jgi:hypothetical protein
LAKSSCGSSPLWLHHKFDPKKEHQEVCDANDIGVLVRSLILGARVWLLVLKPKLLHSLSQNEPAFINAP